MEQDSAGRGRRPRIVVVLVGLVLLLAACSAPATEGGTVRFASVDNVVVESLLGPLRAPGAVAGITGTEFEELPDPDALRASLASQRVDVAVLPTTSAAILARRGLDVRLIGVVDYPLVSVVGPVDGPGGWEGLRDRTLTTAFRGDVTDTVLRILARANGLEPDRSVHFDYRAQLPPVAADLVAGRVENGVLPDVAAARVIAASEGRLVSRIDLTRQWHSMTGRDLPWMAVVVRGEFADSRPEVVESLRTHLAERAVAVREDPARATGPVVVETGNPEPLVRAVLQQAQPRFRTGPQARGDIEDLFGRLLRDSPALIGDGMPDERFYG